MCVNYTFDVNSVEGTREYKRVKEIKTKERKTKTEEVSEE